MSRYAVLATLAFLATLAAAAPTVPGPKVALLHSAYGNYRHRDDYDARLSTLHWPMEKVENTQFTAFAPRLADARRLAEFDLVLGTALYNLGNPQDLLAQRDDVVGWIERGGALVLTDVNYDEHVRFLAKLGEGYAAEVGRCDQGGQPVQVVEPNHVLLTWPNRWQPHGGWAHMKLGARWRVLARCADGSPILAVAGFGKGFVWLSSGWPLDGLQLGNVWECLRLRRAGVEQFAASGWDALAPAGCRSELRLKPVGGAPVPAAWCVEQPDGQVVRAEGRANGLLNLELRLTQRGLHRTWIELGGGAAPLYTSTPRELRLPELPEVALASPTYRGYLALGLPESKASVQFTAWPYGTDLRAAKAAVELRQSGKLVAQRSVAAPTGEGQRLDVEVPVRGLTAGECEVVATASSGTRTLARQSFTLHTLAPHTPQVLLDRHLAIQVNGRPFFPIGVYHVPDADLAKARAMGFNCYQAWGGPLAISRKSLDTAAKADMKVILEMSAFLRDAYQPEQLRAVVHELKDHPALLAWYTVDEPGEKQHAWCEDAYRICREEDPNHPVFLVMCDPSLFGRFAPTTDVLGIDPYPVGGAPIRMVADWSSMAAAAGGATQPFWLIPQLQNLAAYQDATKGRGPTPAEEWCMVAQGLVYGAKGIVYYPWDDGPNGLVHEPALQAELPVINRLLARLGPELAASERTLLNDLAQPELHAAAFAGTRRLVVATNTGPKPVTLRLPGAASLVSLREPARTWTANDGAVSVTLAPLEVVVAERR